MSVGQGHLVLVVYSEVYCVLLNPRTDHPPYCIVVYSRNSTQSSLCLCYSMSVSDLTVILLGSRRPRRVNNDLPIFQSRPLLIAGISTTPPNKRTGQVERHLYASLAGIVVNRLVCNVGITRLNIHTLLVRHQPVVVPSSNVCPTQNELTGKFSSSCYSLVIYILALVCLLSARYLLHTATVLCRILHCHFQLQWPAGLFFRLFSSI